MVAAVKSAGSNLYTVDYKYDVFGNRIEQAEDVDGDGATASVTTRFAWEGAKVLQDAWGGRTDPVGTEDWNIWADLDSSNGLKVRYVRGDEVDQLFSRVKADGTVASYLTDRMGSVRQMVDASGSLANTITYDGFGNVLSETDAAFGDRWKWTGRESNSNTGLQYNRARYYSGETGRWVSEDPMGFKAGDYALTRYVLNTPQNGTDPSGKIPPPIIGGFIGAMGGFITSVLVEVGRTTRGEPFNMSNVVAGTISGAAVGVSVPFKITQIATVFIFELATDVAMALAKLAVWDNIPASVKNQLLGSVVRVFIDPYEDKKKPKPPIQGGGEQNKGNPTGTGSGTGGTGSGSGGSGNGSGSGQKGKRKQSAEFKNDSGVEGFVPPIGPF